MCQPVLLDVPLRAILRKRQGGLEGGRRWYNNYRHEGEVFDFATVMKAWHPMMSGLQDKIHDGIQKEKYC